jgi:hypothetical protein
VEAVEIQDRATTMARWFRFTLRMDSHLGRRASRKLMLAPIPERSVIPAEARRENIVDCFNREDKKMKT